MSAELASLRVEPARDGSGLVATVVGEVDMSNAEDLRRRVMAAVERGDAGGPDLLVDLSAVGYLDTSGLRLLTGLAAAPGVRMRIVAPEGGVVRDVLRITHLDEELDVVDAPGD